MQLNNLWGPYIKQPLSKSFVLGLLRLLVLVSLHKCLSRYKLIYLLVYNGV